MKQFIFAPPITGEKKSNLEGELLSALDNFFLSVVKYELDKEEAVLLHSLGYNENNGCVIDWDVFLRFYETIVLPEEMEKLEMSLSVDHLKKIFASGNIYTRINLECRPETELEWIEVIVRMDFQNNAAYIYIRHSSDNYLLHRIIEMYVYDNCDCFYYLDVDKNSCTMFNGKSNTPLPPVVCADYTSETIKYADIYVVPEDREMVVREMGIDRVLEVLEDKESHFFTCGMWDKNGNYTRKRLEYRYYDRKRKIVLLTRTDITDMYEEHAMQTKILEIALNQARRDSLTKLLNYTEMQAEIERALLNPNGTSAILCLDLDNFKKINDSYGHMVGNKVLVKVAEILNANIDKKDYSARIGGDEFCILLTDVQSMDEVVECANNICNKVFEIVIGDDHASCSIGIGLSPRDGTDYDEVMQIADEKLYQAKAQGKNRFQM